MGVLTLALVLAFAEAADRSLYRERELYKENGLPADWVADYRFFLEEKRLFRWPLVVRRYRKF